MNPTNKVALVTGGAVRVGRAITLALARAGAHVVINYHHSADAALETAAEAEALGVQALAVPADVSDPAQVERMAAIVADRFGGVDILVNSASLFLKTPFPTRDHDPWHRVTAIGIDGPYYCTNAFAPGMLAKGAGVIVNILDLSAWEPWPNFLAHSVSKTALLAMTRQFALELAPAVRVNAVAPGPVLAPPEYTAEQIERIRRRTLLERWGTPEDVAEAVLYFVRAEYVTGNVLFVDGGERFGHRKPASRGR
ncbi:MAG: SDR family oxidoreductase [Anaerolineae bacterium]|nr:SDR family oxidoreductase [Caldilineales bacterium]MDW8269512.1 SDR family oxidoreductase [Anaerolineae bacterium]